jgi:hypothetical protein
MFIKRKLSMAAYSMRKDNFPEASVAQTQSRLSEIMDETDERISDNTELSASKTTPVAFGSAINFTDNSLGLFTLNQI